MAYRGAIFDVDGVLVDSPHDLAWRQALEDLMQGEWRDIRDRTSWTAERFTPAVYQQVMAGKPRMAGARAALGYFGVPDVERRVEQYAAAKQEHVVALIRQGRFRAFPDALRFILAVKDAGIVVAAASSSKNARLFLERIRLDTFAAEQRLDYEFVSQGMTLKQLFDADISGRDFPRGKPDPMIFLTAAAELNLPPDACFVIEDATSGVQAAKAGGMSAIGVARLGDNEMLAGAGADLVVTTLDDVSVRALVRAGCKNGDRPQRSAARHTEQPPSVWTLVYHGFDPARQGLREALCSLGNGYFVTRGALPEARANGVNYPGTYVAGLYNRLVSDVAGRPVENEDLVNLPNWLSLQFRMAGGPWFDLQRAEVDDHRLELDMRHGTLTRRLTWHDADGRRTGLVQRRFVSRKDEHLAGLETEFTAENWTGTLEVRSGLDGTVVNAGVRRYRDLDGRHLRTLGQGEVDRETVDLQVETTQSRVRVALAARTRLLRGGEVAEAERRLVEEPGFVAHQLTVRLEQGRLATVEKIVALYTSRDRAISESRHDACLAVAAADDFAGLLARHQSAWASAWNRFDIELDSANEWTETVLHLHIFHLLQTVSLHTEHLDAGVPARAGTGRPIAATSSIPVTTTRIWSGIFCHSACVASTCSTSEVPIPKAMAPNAPSVPVWESPQTTVIPGWTSPDSGPMIWTIPCRGSSMSNRAIPAPRAFSRKAWICSRLPRSSIRTERSGVVGTLWSGTASIAPGRRTDRPAAARPANAWGLVTSCTRCRSM